MLEADTLSLVGWWTPFKKGVGALLLESLLDLLLLAEAGLALESGGNHDGEVEDSLLGAVRLTVVLLVREDNVEINPVGRFGYNVEVVGGGEAVTVRLGSLSFLR